jgi:hypothetical protein
VVNPDGVRNKVEGAALQGIGGALFEAVRFGDGRIANPRFSQYRVPRLSDLPELAVVILDRKDLPSAGAGETPIVGVAPAIGNAIFAATGIRLRALPMLPDGRLPEREARESVILVTPPRTTSCTIEPTVARSENNGSPSMGSCPRCITDHPEFGKGGPCHEEPEEIPSAPRTLSGAGADLCGARQLGGSSFGSGWWRCARGRLVRRLFGSITGRVRHSAGTRQ